MKEQAPSISIVFADFCEHIDTEDMLLALKQIAERSLKKVYVPSHVIAAQLRAFVNALENTLNVVPALSGPFAIDEIHVSVSIDTEGRISLIGEVGGGIHSSFTLKLSRQGG